MTPPSAPKHHRRSIRLAGYDYTRPGGYFVTLVAQHREELFAQITAGGLQITPLGRIARDEWLRSDGLRPEICLNEDELVIMPNHIHGIVWIIEPPAQAGDEERGARDGGARDGGARSAPQRPIGPRPVGADRVRPSHVVRPEFRREAGSLASFIAGYKASVTSRAGSELALDAVWQRNYYEHIIRNDTDLRRIRAYIADNPRRWIEDQLHPAASPNRFNQDTP